MNRIDVQRRADYKELEESLIGKFAAEADCPQIISDDCIVYEDGVPIILYKRTGWNVEQLRQQLSHTDLHASRRMSKVPFTSYCGTFGFKPRSYPRRQPCSVSALTANEPKLYSMLENWTKEIASIYQINNPAVAQAHEAITNKVRDNYRIGKTMFTSGIINRSSQLPYHYDSGNFKGCWSAMLGLKKYVTGGYLMIPRYNIGLEIADASLSFFNGQEALHGVTPMKRSHPDGERYTIVWYSIEKMWHCVGAEEELQVMNSSVTRANKRKTGKK